MKKEKILALVTASEATKRDLCNQLNILLEGFVRVEGYATDSGIREIVKADLIVLSSSLMPAEAKGLYDETCPVIIANRSLNLEHIDELFQIEKGSSILVVNDDYENAVEVIKLLREVGIDYFDYIPYAPGNRIRSNAKIAITPGEVNLVPGHIETIIDIKARMIDITTVIEILSLLGLLDERSRLVSAKYMEAIVRLNKRLHDSVEEISSMNRYLVKVLHQVNDGIIAFSDRGIITVFNEKSELIFGTKSTVAIGQNIRQIIRDREICDFLAEAWDMSDRLFKINETDVLINKFYIEKMHSTVCTIKNVREAIDMEKKLSQRMTKKGYIAKYKFSDIIGSSPAIRQTVETAKKLAASDTSILISGESGVGKELFASAIHDSSGRSKGPFLAVNFSALPEELVESELFGYEDGAFTGAKKGGRIGLFEQANGGTIFLDEIGDISLRMQARLLRVLQEKEIRRVGGGEILPINVRIICATNKDLAKMCKDGQFREDLYHRLRKLYLKIPPLRERMDDLLELIDYIKQGKGYPTLVLDSEVMETIRKSPWTGNVRELENLIEYFTVVAVDGKIRQSDIPSDFFEIQMGFKEEKDDIVENFCLKGDRGEWIAILEAIKDITEKGGVAGRKTVAIQVSALMPHMTEDKIRRRSDLLHQMGLIEKKPGPGGMVLTVKGNAYLA